MMKLNLIPQKIVFLIREKYFFEIIRNVGYILLGSVLISAILILSVSFAFTDKFYYSPVNINVNKSNISKGLEEFLSKKDRIEKIQAAYIPWTLVLDEVKVLSNDSLSFTDIKINRLDQTALIKGIANDRDSLIAFRKGLEESAYFEKIDFPINNILEKENIKFNISANLDLDKIYDN